MAGPPFSGKSYVVQRMVELSGLHIHVITPKDYRPDEYETLSKVERQEIDISAWEVSLEILQDAIRNSSDDEIIVYDTACASLKMEPYFEMAKKRNHQLLYVWVDAPSANRQRRANTKWLSPEDNKRYITNFEKSLPVLSGLANTVITINNPDGVEPDVSELVSAVLRQG